MEYSYRILFTDLWSERPLGFKDEELSVGLNDSMKNAFLLNCYEIFFLQIISL